MKATAIRSKSRIEMVHSGLRAPSDRRNIHLLPGFLEVSCLLIAVDQISLRVEILRGVLADYSFL